MPTGIVSGATAKAAVEVGRARLLVGGPLAFTGCEVIVRNSKEVSSFVLPLSEMWMWAACAGLVQQVDSLISYLSAPRPTFAGLSLSRPRLMGVVNVTPDSFSDGGAFISPSLAILHALRLKEAGADIIDVGGESTRPGAFPVTPEEEIRRVIPVIHALSERGMLISIDTRHASVMSAALTAGATIVNDVTALNGDPDSLSLAAERKIPVILTHMQGQPFAMQENPNYHLAPLDVYDALEKRVAVCLAAGVTRGDICLDPGIGFGKTVTHNLEVIGRLSILHMLGCVVALGASRKSFIAHVSAYEPPGDRLPGSLVTVVAGLDQGACIIRVHDVKETLQAINVWWAMKTGTCPI